MSRRPAPVPQPDPPRLTPDEEMALYVIRALGDEAFDRLLLAGRYAWVGKLMSGRIPR